MLINKHYQTQKAIICTIFTMLFCSACQTTHTTEKDITQIIKQDTTAINYKKMAFVAAGLNTFGNNNGYPAEKPSFEAYTKSFYLDTVPVTIADFKAFIQATNYKTDAEKFGNALVFLYEKKKWELLDYANWQFPLGDTLRYAPLNHPVTQVSWRDASAYCYWKKKRLPSEIEWEHAAKNAKNEPQQYTWGNELQVNKQVMANTWQGYFPQKNTLEDGFLYTSPVGYFPKNKIGLYDMAGNVWEWCSDDFINHYERNDNKVAENEVTKTIKGGSFLCDLKWCHNFRTSSRQGVTSETSSFHIGFRCACDMP
ncbi:MAG: formylglycine-generating enzyme family protein [Chitinophagales bacterium]